MTDTCRILRETLVEPRARLTGQKADWQTRSRYSESYFRDALKELTEGLAASEKIKALSKERDSQDWRRAS